jgi:hypothetical protein
MRRKAKTAKRRGAKATTRRKAKTKTTVKQREAKVTCDTAGLTLKQLTEAFNAAVPQANRLGIGWAKHHTSVFESKALGARVLAKRDGGPPLTQSKISAT